MQTLQQIQTAVGEWSEKNFGGQETPFIAVHEGGPKKGTAMLGSLAPLMGVAEELGELAGARNDHDRRDALGDILIYFCDYGAREKFVLPWGSSSKVQYVEAEMKDSPFDGMVVELGKLFHATLKRHQGIRGMDDALNYQAARNRAVDMFLVHLCRYCNVNLVTNPLHIVNETWNTIVKKRDWKADKASGGGHAHDAVQIEDTGAIPVVEDDAE